MAHFYGTVAGRAKTEASRCGSKDSGITVYAASWEGAVKVSVYHDPSTGRDKAIVELVPWRGRGKHQTLYTGEVSGYNVVEEIKLRLDAGEGDDA